MSAARGSFQALSGVRLGTVGVHDQKGYIMREPRMRRLRTISYSQVVGERLCRQLYLVPLVWLIIDRETGEEVAELGGCEEGVGGGAVHGRACVRAGEGDSSGASGSPAFQESTLPLRLLSTRRLMWLMKPC